MIPKEVFLIFVGILWVIVFLYIIFPSGTFPRLWNELKNDEDDEDDEEVTYATCGEENPGRPGNYCELIEGHWDATPHRDGEDWVWRGRDL